MDERDFFNETEESKPAPLNCPYCHQVDTYDLRWIIRRKKNAPPQRASEDDRKKFAALKPYMVRRDDMMVCKNARCRKTFEVSGVQSVAFLTADGQVHAPALTEEDRAPAARPEAPKFRPRIMRQH